MKLSISLLTFWFTLALGQTYPACTADLVKTDECTAVIDANACYNKNRWNAQTLTCIGGTSDADKIKKVCKCCACVGKVMCDWVTKQKYAC